MLVLTDMFGGTPANLAVTFLETEQVEVITGVNLPMLIKLARPPKVTDLLSLARDMREHGRNAIWVASDLLTRREGVTQTCVGHDRQPARTARARGGEVRPRARAVSPAGSASDAADAKWTARASWDCCCWPPRRAATITISADGPDEDDAVAALCALVERGFDEAPCA